ncbi:MAG: hypothetical protein RDU25_01605 [Patescibacteria group bacterium]|nr:hypothetical protein [Patescibacteria group bacterium]
MNLRQIPTIVRPNFTAPSTPEEEEQCRVVADAVAHMEIVSACMLQSKDANVSLCYCKAARPKIYWSNWLIAQIGLVGSDAQWLAKINAMVPQAKELTFIPRPDKLDVSLALQARDEASSQQVSFIRLTVVFAQDRYSRIFHLTH